MKRSNKRGFTLTEVLIAITVFSVGILAVSSMQIKAIQGNSSANDMSQAITLAQDKIEELMALNITDPAFTDSDGDGTAVDTNNDGIDDVNSNNFGLDDTTFDNNNGTINDADHGPIPDQGTYRVYWNVAVNFPGTNVAPPPLRMINVRVIVVWTKGGRQKSVSLDYIKSNV